MGFVRKMNERANGKEEARMRWLTVTVAAMSLLLIARIAHATKDVFVGLQTGERTIFRLPGWYGEKQEKPDWSVPIISMARGDIHGDGVVDLFMGTADGNLVRFPDPSNLENEEVIGDWGGSVFPAITCIAVGPDYDDDGVKDVYAGLSTVGWSQGGAIARISKWKDKQIGWKQYISHGWGPPGTRITGIAIDDVDGDGTEDLFFTTDKSGLVVRYPNAPIFKGNASNMKCVDGWGPVHCIAIGDDVDGDGYKDIYIGVSADNGSIIRLTLDSDGLPWEVERKKGWGGAVTHIETDDIDGDGVKDLFLATANGTVAHSPSGKLDFPEKQKGRGEITTLAIGPDIDNDGIKDVYIGRPTKKWTISRWPKWGGPPGPQHITGIGARVNVMLSCDTSAGN